MSAHLAITGTDSYAAGPLSNLPTWGPGAQVAAFMTTQGQDQTEEPALAPVPDPWINQDPWSSAQSMSGWSGTSSVQTPWDVAASAGPAAWQDPRWTARVQEVNAALATPPAPLFPPGVLVDTGARPTNLLGLMDANTYGRVPSLGNLTAPTEPIVLTDQFLQAMVLGRSAMAAQRPEGQGRVERNNERFRTAFQQARRLADLMRVGQRPVPTPRQTLEQYGRVSMDDSDSDIPPTLAVDSDDALSGLEDASRQIARSTFESEFRRPRSDDPSTQALRQFAEATNMRRILDQNAAEDRRNGNNPAPPFRQGKGQGKGRQEQPAPTTYDGDQRQCSICVHDFTGGERVVRIRCRHMFHAQCWQEYYSRAEGPAGAEEHECPNCRGPGHVLASWNYVEVGPVTQAGSSNLLTANFPGAVEDAAEPHETEFHNILTPRSVATTVLETPFGTPTGNFIILPSTWVDADSWGASSQYTIGDFTGPTREHPPEPDHSSMRMCDYHADTRLADGRPGLLVDPGSRGNLSGSTWIRTAASKALHYGKHPTEERRKQSLSVMGVGNGSQTCSHDVKMPITLANAQGKPITGDFTTPVVDHSDLPALLGLQSLRDSRAILDMGTLRLHFVGQGGAEIALSPGSETFQCEISPSGHLVVPCCEYELEAKKNDTGSFSLNRQAPISLHTDTPSASSALSPEVHPEA